MNPFRIRDAQVWTFTLPLRNPFVTALGSKSETTNAAIRLRLSGGAQGYGEASSSIVMKRLSPAALARALEGLIERLRGRDARELEPLAADIWRLCPHAPAAAAAFECAALDAMLGAQGIGMAEWFGGAQDSIETDLTISAWPAPQAAEAARMLGRELRIILDGNQGFTAEGALRFVERAARRARVVLFEQPLPRAKLKEAAWLNHRSPAPLAADESVRSPAEALAVLDAGAAEVINVKTAKLGLRRSLDVVALARAEGKGLMIGCMQESARGLSASVHLACGLGAFSYADLDSDALLGEGQPRGGFAREGPLLRLT